MKYLQLIAPKEIPDHIIYLEGSKSISNRILIIRALANTEFPVSNLSESDDTITMQALLSQSKSVYDAGHAGTTYRFLTAFLALKSGTQILTGTPRMKQRPVGPLVNALRTLGAQIKYLEKEGFPPLEIGPMKESQDQRHIEIYGDISSQFISALLMIAPCLPQGICIHIKEKLVSKPYVAMTLAIMAKCGISYQWDENTIEIKPQPYHCSHFDVESDWSAASYWYSIVNRYPKSKIGLSGLFPESLQGDSQIKILGEKFGIKSVFDDQGILWVENSEHTPSDHLEFNLIETPDLAQTLVIMCASSGIEGIFTGLQTLKIKETNRIEALMQELRKFDVAFFKLPDHFSKKTGIEYYMVQGNVQHKEGITIETYKDHRMAMAFAPLASSEPLKINDPMVINKSYPGFWSDLAKIGFLVGEF